MGDLKSDKIVRVLSIYNKLQKGETVDKATEARLFGVNIRSIQRDIDDIRAFFENDSNDGVHGQVLYNRTAKSYRMDYVKQINLQNSEVFALCKILFDSRAFTKSEMKSMLDRIAECCVSP